MDNVIMPELITPKFAEVIAENPEVLKMIIDYQPGEEVIVGQNCTLDSNCIPTNVKLVFCNVTIGLNNSEGECDKGHSTEEKKEKIGCCHIKKDGKGHKQESLDWREQSSELSQLKLEVAVLEARIEENEKMLKLIPRQIFNRKLVGRCKRDLNEAIGNLAVKKKELEYRVWLMEFGDGEVIVF